jgi:hypothetical protein
MVTVSPAGVSSAGASGDTSGVVGSCSVASGVGFGAAAFFVDLLLMALPGGSVAPRGSHVRRVCVAAYVTG